MPLCRNAGDRKVSNVMKNLYGSFVSKRMTIGYLATGNFRCFANLVVTGGLVLSGGAAGQAGRIMMTPTGGTTKTTVESTPQQPTTAQDVGCKSYDNGCLETAGNLLKAEAILITLYAAIPIAEAAAMMNAFSMYGIRIGAGTVVTFCTEKPKACVGLVDAMAKVKEQLAKIKDAKGSYENCVKLIQESVMRCAGINPEIIDGGLRPAIGTMCMKPAAGNSFCGTCCNANASLGEKQCDKATTEAEKVWCKKNTEGCMRMCTAMQEMEDAANKIKDAEFKRRMIEEARMREYMKDSMKNYTTPYTTPTVDPTLRTRPPGM